MKKNNTDLFLQTKCKRQILCLQCRHMIYFNGSKSKKDEALANHACLNPMRYCRACANVHHPDDDCILSLPKFKSKFPKLCFISGIVSSPSNLDCLVCHSKSPNGKEKCEIHKKIADSNREPYCNFLYCLREVMIVIVSN